MKKWLILSLMAAFCIFTVACDDNKKSDTDDTVTDETVTDDTVTDEIITDDPIVPDEDNAYVIGECTAIALDTVIIKNSAYQSGFTVELGSADLPDVFSLMFFEDAETLQSELTVGSYDLAAGENANYSSCTECALIFEDMDGQGAPAKLYYQYDGTLEITAVKAGTIESKGTITARMIEVTIESGTFISTPIKGGNCYELTGSWDTICVPDCTDKVCGTDGCGGTCGDGCEAGLQCNEDQSGCIPCTPITIADIAANTNYEGVYTGSLNEELGSADFDDIFSMEFYGAQAAGAYDLTGTNYADCPQCVVVWQDSADDPAATPKIFFQDTGEMTIEEFTATAQGGIGQKSKGVLKDVRLIEVTIDGATYTSTPVPGGACLLLEEGAWDTM